LKNYDFLPTDKAIEAAVLAIRNQYGLIQRLAEEFFEIRENLKFRPIGRNSNNVATKNYPDAYAIQPDERLAIAEATTGNWRNHILNDDLPRLRLLGKNRVGIYRLFAVENEAALIPQKAPVKKKQLTNVPSTAKKPALLSEVELRQMIATECGIQIGAVEFIFLRQFIKEIRDPKYLRILLFLKLPVSPAPFCLAGDYSPIGIAEITPNAEEFSRGGVVPKESVTGLMAALDLKKTVVLEGRAASGKTSLALAVAHQWNANGTSFYIDLDSYDLNSAQAQRELLDAGVSFAGERSLIIMDNCHKADKQQLEAVLTVWKNLAIESRVLLTRRETAANYGPGVQRAYLVRREISTADFLAIYFRLVKVCSGSDDPPMPPARALKEWANWKGDLIAFSLALLPTLHEKGSSTEWKLSINHAVRYVRDKYVAPLSEKEQSALIKVALLARLEMPASLQGLNFVPPEQALTAGIILESRHGPQRLRTRFRLPHYQLGELILQGSQDTLLRVALREVAVSDPFQAAYIARKMHEMGDDEGAKEVLLMVEEELLTFSEDFSPAYLATISQLYFDYELRTAFEIEERLLAAMDMFLPPNMNPVEGLAGFLVFAKSKMPTLYARAVAKVAESATVNRICEQFANAVPSSVASMVRFVEREQLPCATILLASVKRQSVLASLAVRLSKQSARDIEKFLLFIKGIGTKEERFFRKSLVRCPALAMSPMRVLALPLADIVQMIRIAPVASALSFERVSNDDWRGRDWALERNLQALIVPAAQVFGRVGRMELAAEVAKRALQYWSPPIGGSPKSTARELAILMYHLPFDDDCCKIGQFLVRVNSADGVDRICKHGNFEDIARMLFEAWLRFGSEAKSLMADNLKLRLVRLMRVDLETKPQVKPSLLMAAGIVEIFGMDAYPLAENLSATQLILKHSDCVLSWLGLKHIAARTALTIYRDAAIPAPRIHVSGHTADLSKKFDEWWQNLPTACAALQ
jgi:chloramphenicol 3-O-phosphotransferase